MTSNFTPNMRPAVMDYIRHEKAALENKHDLLALHREVAARNNVMVVDLIRAVNKAKEQGPF